MIPIPEVTKVDAAFGNIKHMPKMEDIPKEFTDRDNKWVQLFNTIFYYGGKDIQFKAKEGVDADKAIRAIRSIMVSYQPQHEHKTAACAFLFSEWFDDWRIEKPESEKAGPMVAPK